MAKGKTKEIGGVGVLVIVVVGFIVLTSYPKIEINYYTKYSSYGSDNEWTTTNFNITLYNNGIIYNPPANKICFRIKNTAEPLLQYIIPASNLKIYISTNANCEDCNLYTEVGALQAQTTGDVCRSIKSNTDLQNLSINVTANWQALLMSPSTERDYLCQKIIEKIPQTTQDTYVCKLIS